MQKPSQHAHPTEDTKDKKDARASISNILIGPESEEYSVFLEQYGQLMRHIQNIGEERGAGDIKKGFVELDDADHAQKEEIEKAMLSAFRNLPEVFEELRLSLINAPSNRISDNVENLEELKRALEGLYEILGELAKNSKTNNKELISAISNVQDGVEELSGRTSRMIAGFEDLLALASRG